ncbi:hypothetical protein GWO61_08295 [Corynebacterium macginleyi]|uniref:hypothetical protein n=1 Tax=Corynebacterium macginleyi TaxID=38290 RepID=UPI0019099C92|nr:hypothetical protein [Corynebacterium macginleyi]MBK4151155.1 hypothetical protein [Corynebacterium macginleyi]MBK4168244.1 hypothetical protein [Corynebacterium macginleyi]
MTERLASTAPTATARNSRWRNLLLLVLLAVPLIVGTAVAAWSQWEPAHAWSSAAQPYGAPQAISASPELKEAAAAASRAQAQASILKSGADRLQKGTSELDKGAGELGEGVAKLAGGSQELAAGLNQLRSGTNTLGGGATELANTVGGAVDQVVGLGVVQGQILEAIDGTVRDLQGNDSKEAKQVRSELGDLRIQVANFRLDESLVGELQKLKQGSRELSNQLAVNGYAYHDGINQAVAGAQQLNQSIAELNSRVDEALDGVGQLDDGAGKLTGLAKQNQSNLGEVQRALPPAHVAAEEDARQLSPVIAMLISALTLLAGSAAGVAWKLGLRPWLMVLGGSLAVVAVGEILLFVLSIGLTPIAAVSAGGALFLGALSSALIVRGLLELCGMTAGSILAAIFGIGQTALVGWLWKSAAIAGVDKLWQVVANLLPLNWTTAAVTVAGNDGNAVVLWTCLGVLGAMTLVGLSGIKWLSPARKNKKFSTKA